jgi:nucleoside-diphosphate-sugar epimerase
MNDVAGLDVPGLEKILSAPSDAASQALAGVHGNILVLGAAGKMGPTLAMMLSKAAPKRNIYAVSRFTDDAVQTKLEQAGITTIAADLLDEAQYRKLPSVENVFFLAGMKFGASGDLPLTWAQNCHIPALVARHYKHSRIVAFSTGNVYPFVDINSGGATEDTPPEAIGEYAQSCLARERMFQYFSKIHDTPVTIIRLNYANEPRYGIIVDLTLKILNDQPIGLTMGAINLIWQRDANDYIIRSITLAQSPPAVLNVAGPETISIRSLAGKIANLLGKEPKFVSQESASALLSDASRCISLFGSPQMTLDQMVAMIVQWVKSGKEILNKPTKYDIRNGKF